MLLVPRQKIIFHIYDVPPEYLQANGGKAGFVFFFRGQHCRCGVSLLLFIQNVPEVPMDADVEFEFGGVYRFGQVLCVI